MSCRTYSTCLCIIAGTHGGHIGLTQQSYTGLSKTVYIHHIRPHILCFPAKYFVYAPFIYMVLANPKHTGLYL